jgi:tight adherence protein B
MELTPSAWIAGLAGALASVGLTMIVLAARPHPGPAGGPALARLRRRWVRLPAASALGGGPHRGWRAAMCIALGVAVWIVTAWPVAGVAVAVIGQCLPWLLGSARVMQQRIDRIDALAVWCRRMADTLLGGGAVGLAQAITLTAAHAPEEIEAPVRLLAQRIREGHGDHLAAFREFADGIDDRVGDSVAAALGLALHQQSAGVARVLRQLADGVARDVRARRDIEAERAEARQSIRMLLVIQGAVLALLALVPGFAAPYRNPLGQLLMAALLCGTFALLVWMRQLALGRPAPRFLGAGR